MKTFLDNLERRWGITRITFVLLLVALLLYGLAWWIRVTIISFNSTIFYLAGGVIAINSLLTFLYARREATLGHMFAGSALAVQLLLLILLWKAAQGVWL